ncbi:antiviral reverse transcriptase Drt4 [Roseateles sp. GG27B]
MAVNKEFLLRGLLQYNYLPTTRKSKEELPPIFTSESFTPEVAKQLLATQALPENKARKLSGYDQVEYKLTRYSSVSRLLSIPHPVPHAKLCFSLYENWDKFDFIASNTNSRIKPEESDDGRVIIMSGYGGAVGKSMQHLHNAFGKRYRVKTDIANCFPSIYSHAVAWALVTRSEAKRLRNEKNQWFNIIDSNLRACRRQETQGVAIGPGTSNIIAEIIMARIDEKLRVLGLSFVRYIDDYECYCDSEAQAQEFVRVLERSAADFKLQLNVRKTEFSRLPQPVSDSWILELGQHAPKGDNSSTFDVFRFLDVAVFLAQKHPEGSVLKYAASVVAALKLSHPKNVECLDYLLGLAFHHSDLLPKLQQLIDSTYVNFFGHIYDFGGVHEKLDALLTECAELRRSDGMSWALFLLGRARKEPSKENAAKVIETEDSMAILTLYWASETYRPDVVNFAKALDVDDSHELDRHWLLLYQLYFDGHIGNPYAGDTCFEVLKGCGVRFMLPKEEFSPVVQDPDGEFS